ncbi:enoyl-CoA hydratase/isomerase family protein [Tsukamurella sp. PLM1]|uniref:enoyl-CoA hydratase/isomerase family protein n=1 Tax=Tsukamurella sp. PLM1 TaxID=2929795 RepID=UPI00206A4025|nr:enoyl-CoA hydratase/isomerase family protein [Tsukamurella sp. PLM1]BDH58553.1 2-(1,2-epoxy-1,2-dihydrophenyl)acetyl-CoA isomerase [Tsukamurella sp. PLM1]
MVTVDTADGIATIILDRPERLNALTTESMDELRAAFERAATSDSVTAVVLTGRGRGFCSGLDLVDLDTTIDDLGKHVEQLMHTNLNPLCETILHSPVPVVAAVNGPCVGGGLGLALSADVVIAAESAYFLVPQVAALGIVPDAGATWLLPRLVGRARALGMSLTGERITAETAERWGLLWRCVPDADLLAEAHALAARIARAPAAAIATRALVDEATSGTISSLLRAEARTQRALFREPIVRENIMGFAAR